MNSEPIYVMSIMEAFLFKKRRRINIPAKTGEENGRLKGLPPFTNDMVTYSAF